MFGVASDGSMLCLGGMLLLLLEMRRRDIEKLRWGLSRKRVCNLFTPRERNRLLRWSRHYQIVCGDQQPSFTDIPNLVYGICILYEIMRLFPVIGALPTRTEENQILLNKHFIAKNLHRNRSGNLHRNEKYWSPDPQSFNPSLFDNRATDETKGMDSKRYENWQILMGGNLRVSPKEFSLVSEKVRSLVSVFHCGIASAYKDIKLIGRTAVRRNWICYLFEYDCAEEVHWVEGRVDYAGCVGCC